MIKITQDKKASNHIPIRVKNMAKEPRKLSTQQEVGPLPKT